MSNPSSKWDKIYQESQKSHEENKNKKDIVLDELENTYDPVDTAAELARTLNTQIGATDTQEKKDFQENNLSPVDTEIENKAKQSK
ncbi:MAG: hypothetical protein HYX60_10565 [Legionella longbeachae]|nr:hypothetical protein [Legionella longbeachae]